MKMLSIQASEMLTERIIKLCEVNGGTFCSCFFHMSNADFIAWRDAFNICAPALAREITQTPEGLLELVDAWENKVPMSDRCTIKRHQAAVDDTNERNYNVNIRPG